MQEEEIQAALPGAGMGDNIDEDDASYDDADRCRCVLYEKVADADNKLRGSGQIRIHFLKCLRQGRHDLRHHERAYSPDGYQNDARVDKRTAYLLLQVVHPLHLVGRNRKRRGEVAALFARADHRHEKLRKYAGKLRERLMERFSPPDIRGYL